MIAPRAIVSAVLLASLVACTETRGSLGDECLKDEDCLSTICSQLKCVAAPTILDAAADVSSGEPDASDDATDDAPSDS